MIICKTCGHANEEGAEFCGNCGSFLEWTGQAVEQPQPQAPAPVPLPAPVPPVPGPDLTGASEEETVVAVPAEPATDSIVCPACGLANPPDRTYCRRCATELRPAVVEAVPVVPEAPAGRAGPPMALIGGGLVVALLVAGIAFVLLGGRGPEASPGVSPSTGSASPGLSEPPTASPGDTPSGSPSTEPSSPPPGGPVFSGLVVFSAERGGDSDLWVWDAADDSLRELIATRRNEDDPSWSPDRGVVVYRDPRGLRMVRADGRPFDPPDFTHHDVDRNPAWSPDDEYVVFASTRKPSTSLDIYRRLADDNRAEAERLVSDAADDWDPAWSPDGDEIVFVSRRSGDAHLFVMSSDGRDETELDLGPGIYDDPSWSPDGQWLAFTRRDDKNSPKALHVARLDGSEMRRLTDVEIDENDMAWSPDGRYLALARSGNRALIVVIEVETGDEVATFGVDRARNGQPDWR